jgi:hypothetical protein
MNGGPTVRRLHRERQSRLLRMQSRSRRTARGSESGRLDEMPGYPPGAKLTEIDAFVHEYLIPYIRGVSSGGVRTKMAPGSVDPGAIRSVL